MAAISRGRGREFNAWPGYVDVLSTLLMVVIFVLMVFVIAQVFLSRALTGSQDALAELRTQLAALSDTLAMRVEEKAQLSAQLADLSSALAAATAKSDSLNQQLIVLREDRDALKKERDAYAAELATAQQGAAELDEKTKAELAAKAKEIEDAYKVIDANAEKVRALTQDLAVLQSLRDEMARKLLAQEDALKAQEDALKKVDETRQAAEEELKKREQALSLSEEEKKKTASDLIEEKKISESARLQLVMLNQQLLALRNQIATLNAALEASEQKAKDQEVQIADLGSRLNAALANKVAELASYRSEFFGRLKEVLGERPDIQVVGDRFVFQSEVLFDVGSDEIGEPGKVQLAQFAKTLLEIGNKIPQDIDWILRVDGHTDAQPIYTYKFPSNWELSTARAIAVVKFLESQGVPASRLVAAGFAEYRPLDVSGTVEAYRHNRRIELKLDQR